jgi:hypothetical protein
VRRARQRGGLGAAAVLAAAASVTLAPAPAAARDCPSLLQGHLFELGDTVELGFEIRAFYLGLSAGEGLPTSRPDGGRRWTDHVLTGLRTLVYWYPADGLTLGLEDEIRYRWPGWFDRAAPGLDHRPVQLFLAWESRGAEVVVGLQPFAFGTGAALDQRFVGASFGVRSRVIAFASFGGATMRHFMRNAANSMWMSTTSDTNGWKLLSQDLGENWVAGVTASLRFLRPYRLEALYLFSRTGYEHLRSHVVAVHAAGPIVRGALSFVVEPLLMIDERGLALPALVAELRAVLGAGERAPTLLVAGATALRHDDDRRFDSPFENLSWGAIRRFNLFQGHLARLRFAWPLHERFRAYVDWVVAVPGRAIEDELDAGVEVRVSDLYRLTLAYVGANLVDSALPSHAVYVEARVIVGR